MLVNVVVVTLDSFTDDQYYDCDWRLTPDNQVMVLPMYEINIISLSIHY